MEQEYKVFGYRWVNLLIYTLVTFGAGMGFLAMAPLLEIMAQRWTVGFGAASLLMSVIGLFQVFLSIPTGWVSGTANFCPEMWSKLVHTCIDEGDFVKARQMWYRILPFVEIATVGDGGQRPDWIAVIKRGLELRKRKVGPVRPPMLPLTEQVDAHLQKTVAAMSLGDTPAAAE